MNCTLIKMLALTAIIAFPALRADPDSHSVKQVVIEVSDNMKFSITKIEAQPGQMIHVTLRNQGTLSKEVMGHNWILLKAGFDPNAYSAAAATAKADDFLPKSLINETLATIGLIGAKQSGEATFSAPAEPGKYPFLCSYPGHCQIGMRGTLVVSSNGR